VDIVTTLQRMHDSDLTDAEINRLMARALIETAQGDQWGFASLTAEAVSGNATARYLLDLLPNPPSGAIQ